MQISGVKNLFKKTVQKNSFTLPRASTLKMLINKRKMDGILGNALRDHADSQRSHGNKTCRTLNRIIMHPLENFKPWNIH
jgi:hypothetical protein